MRAILFLLLIVAALPLHGQQGIFIKAGYAWNRPAPSNADVRFMSPPRLGAPPFAWHNEWTDVDAGSFSSGHAAYAEVGYCISERVGFSVAGRYVFAPTERRYSERVGLAGTTAETVYTRRAEKPFFLEPGIRIYVPLSNKVEAHLRAGVLLPLRHTIHAETYTSGPGSTPLWETASELRTCFSPGGFGGADVTADLGAGFGLFFQGSFGLLSLRALDETVQRIAVAGNDEYTDRLTKAERVVEYGDYVEQSSVPANQPSRQPTYLVPFNYWSVEVGVGWSMNQ
jgi:hypothetical protein